jgi:hypothetical protein
MKMQQEIEPGSYTADGQIIQSAMVRLIFSDLELEEYKNLQLLIHKTFGEQGVPKHLQRLVLSGDGVVHDGKNPSCGRGT